MLPTTIIGSLVIHDRFGYDVYNVDISDMICHPHHLDLEQYIIQQKYMIKISDICDIMTLYILKLIYNRWGIKNVQHLMLDNPERNKI